MDRFRSALDQRLHQREDVDFSDVGVPEETSPTAIQNTLIARAARQAVQEMLEGTTLGDHNTTALYMNSLYSPIASEKNATKLQGIAVVPQNTNDDDDSIGGDKKKTFSSFQQQLVASSPSVKHHLRRHQHQNGSSPPSFPIIQSAAQQILDESSDPLFRAVAAKTRGKRFNNAICVIVSASTFSRSVLALHMERRGWTCICVARTTTSAFDQEESCEGEINKKDNEEPKIAKASNLQESLREIEKQFRYGQQSVKFAGQAKLGHDSFDLKFDDEGSNHHQNHDTDQSFFSNDQFDTSSSNKNNDNIPKIRLVIIDAFTHELPHESARNIRNLVADELTRQQLQQLQQQHQRDKENEHRQLRAAAEAAAVRDIVVVQLTQIRSDGGRGLQLPNFVEPDPEALERVIASGVGSDLGQNQQQAAKKSTSPRKKSSSFITSLQQQNRRSRKNEQADVETGSSSSSSALSNVDVIVRSAFTSTLAEKISSFFLTESARSRSRIVNVTSVYDSIRGILGGVSSRRFDSGDGIIGEMYDCFSPSSDLIQEMFKLKKKQEGEIQKQQERRGSVAGSTAAAAASTRRSTLANGSLLFSPLTTSLLPSSAGIITNNSLNNSNNNNNNNNNISNNNNSHAVLTSFTFGTSVNNNNNNINNNFGSNNPVNGGDQGLLSQQQQQQQQAKSNVALKPTDPATFLSFESDPRFVVLRAHYQHMRKLLDRANEEIKGKERRIRKMQDEVGTLTDEVKHLAANQSGMGVAALMAIPKQTDDVGVSTADDDELGQASWLQERNRLLDRVTRSEAKAKRLQDQIASSSSSPLSPSSSSAPPPHPHLQSTNFKLRIQELEEKIQDLETERNLLKEVADAAQKQWFEMAGSASARMESSLRGSVVFANAEAQRVAGRGALVIGGSAFSNVSSLVDQLKQQANKIKSASVWKKALREMLRVAESSAMAALDVDANYQRSKTRRPTLVRGGGSQSKAFFENDDSANGRDQDNHHHHHHRHLTQGRKDNNNSDNKNFSISWRDAEDDNNDEHDDHDDKSSSSSSNSSTNSEPFASSCPTEALRKHKKSLQPVESTSSSTSARLHRKARKSAASSTSTAKQSEKRKEAQQQHKNNSNSNTNNNNDEAAEADGDYLIKRDPLQDPNFVPPGLDIKLLNDTSYHYPTTSSSNRKRETDTDDRDEKSGTKSREGKRGNSKKQNRQNSTNDDTAMVQPRTRSTFGEQKSSSYSPEIAQVAVSANAQHRGLHQYYYGLENPPRDSFDDDSCSTSHSSTSSTSSSPPKKRHHHHHNSRTNSKKSKQKQNHHHHRHQSIESAYQNLEALSKNLGAMFQGVVDYAKKAAASRRQGLEGLFEAVVRIADKATRQNDGNKVVRLRTLIDEKQKILDDILARPLGADQGSMLALRNRGDEFFKHYLERYHLVAEHRRLEENCNIQHSSRVKEHILRNLLQAQNRIDEVGSYLLNNNELFLYSESRMEIIKLLQELAPWISSDEYELLQREGKSAITEMISQCQIARTTTVDEEDQKRRQQQQRAQILQEQKLLQADPSSSRRRLSVSVAQFERTAKALSKTATTVAGSSAPSSANAAVAKTNSTTTQNQTTKRLNRNFSGDDDDDDADDDGDRRKINFGEENDEAEVPTQELASELEKEISRFVLDEGVDAIRDILKQLQLMWNRDDDDADDEYDESKQRVKSTAAPKISEITNGSSNSNSLPTNAVPQLLSFSSPSSTSRRVGEEGEGEGVGSQRSTKNNSNSNNNNNNLHYIINNWKRDATRMVRQTANDVATSMKEFRRKEQEAQEFVEKTGFDIRPYNRLVAQRLLFDPFSKIPATSTAITDGVAQQQLQQLQQQQQLATTMDPSATNIRIVSVVEAFREASLVLHDQLRRLLLQLKERTPLTKVKIVDFAAEHSLYRKKRLRQTSEFPGLMCVDAELVSRFADYFESETKGQYLVARSQFKIKAAEMTKSTHTQTSALHAIEEQARSQLRVTSSSKRQMSAGGGGDTAAPTSSSSPTLSNRRQDNFDATIRSIDASSPRPVDLVQTLRSLENTAPAAKFASPSSASLTGPTNAPATNNNNNNNNNNNINNGLLSMNPNSPGHFAKMEQDGTISIQYLEHFGKDIVFAETTNKKHQRHEKQRLRNAVRRAGQLVLDFERKSLDDEDNNNNNNNRSDVSVQVTEVEHDEGNSSDSASSLSDDDTKNRAGVTTLPLLSPQKLGSSTKVQHQFSPAPPPPLLPPNLPSRNSLNRRILREQLEIQQDMSYFGLSKKKQLDQHQRDQEEKERVLKTFVPLPAIERLNKKLLGEAVGFDKKQALHHQPQRIFTADEIRHHNYNNSNNNNYHHSNNNNNDDNSLSQVLKPETMTATATTRKLDFCSSGGERQQQQKEQKEQRQQRIFDEVRRDFFSWNPREEVVVVSSTKPTSTGAATTSRKSDKQQRLLLGTSETTFGQPTSSSNVTLVTSRPMALAPTMKCRQHGNQQQQQQVTVSAGVSYNVVVIDD